VRKYLFAQGFRYRKNDKKLPGKPDIVLPKYKIVIFVNGCFWHNHCCCSNVRIPKTNTDYWKGKIIYNAQRDEIQYAQLQNLGWRVLVAWECELKKKIFDCTMEKLVQSIKG